ncbi:synaptonemal complex central element protein 1-like [Patagioenas fasciata]|uniref:synaptonemal complex central element protein 1-like n=1 Tax=Patagioenas fasciata TaxID=372321 RepID=UPI003A999941
MEMLMGRLRSLNRARQAAAQDLAQSQGHTQDLQQQLDQLEERRAALDGLWQQKQESLRVSRLRWEELEAKGQRRWGSILNRQQELAGEGQRRDRIRNQRRGHRFEFWRQLEDIMEQHKELQGAHAPAQLEAELVKLEEKREKLLSQERHLLELEKQLGPEAFVATRLVEQEMEAARQRLGAELGQKLTNQHRRDRLLQDMERLQRPLEATTP